MSLADRAVLATLPLLPRPLVWLVARRYVAGNDLSDALLRVAAVRRQGFGAILDVLGEGVHDRSGAEAAAAEYRRAIAGLAGVDDDCPVSVKPTHLGLLVDRALCAELLAGLCQEAAAAGRRVRLEMEDSPTIDGTLEVFSRVRRQHRSLGCVIQSRMHRSAADVERLLAEGTDLDVRLVKGIYLEPPEIAHTAPAAISRAYVELARRLVEAGATIGFATHDRALADACIGLVSHAGWERRPIAQRPYEFQLLMGVRGDEAERLRDAGHRVRIYVPYGRDWHAYSMRRLKRNPEVARHVLRAFLRLG